MCWNDNRGEAVRREAKEKYRWELQMVNKAHNNDALNNAGYTVLDRMADFLLSTSAMPEPGLYAHEIS